MKVSYYFFKRKHFIFNLLPCFFFLVFIGNFYLLLSICFFLMWSQIQQKEIKINLAFCLQPFTRFYYFHLKKGLFFVQPHFLLSVLCNLHPKQPNHQPLCKIYIIEQVIIQCYLNKFFNKKPMIDQSFAMVTLRYQFYQKK